MRRGLNRIEVGIILTIVGVLIALLLPAVQAVRAASWRINCQNSLKQHGLALHNYHDQNTRFPAGTLPNPDLPPEQRLSFHASLVPFMECDNLYSLLAKDTAWDSARNAGVLAHRSYKRYQCPMWVYWQNADPKLTASGHLAVTTYVGVAGVGADAATRPADAPGIGLFGYDRAATRDDVRDGLTNTLALIETGHDPAPWLRGGPGTVRAVGVDDGQFGGTHFTTGMWFRKHPGEFAVLRADGSAWFVQKNADRAILTPLATIAGREEVPDW